MKEGDRQRLLKRINRARETLSKACDEFPGCGAIPGHPAQQLAKAADFAAMAYAQVSARTDTVK